MSTDITNAAYCTEYQPIGVWLLVEKDVLPEKTASGLILASEGRTNQIKWTGTGIIRRMPTPQWHTFEQGHDAYWLQMFREGDHIGFSCQTPIISPAPPDYRFVDSGDQQSTKFVTIVVTDIVTIFLPTETHRQQWQARFAPGEFRLMDEVRNG